MKGNDDAVKYCFTKYLEMALKRARKDYLNKEMKRCTKEEVTESEYITTGAEEQEPRFLFQSYEKAEQIPLDVESIRTYFSACLTQAAFDQTAKLNDLEILIAFAKIYRELTFAEIGYIFRIDASKVASVYSYARKKMQKGWEKNEI